MTDISLPYIGGTPFTPGSPEPGGYFGPYRGIVTNTSDPAGQNRIKATLPQLFGNTSTEIDWALPMISPPGLSSLPTPGQGVWIQFEGGDINYPVWTGMWQAEPSVAPYEVAGAGASAVAQSEAYTTAAIAAIPAQVPLLNNPCGRIVGLSQVVIASSTNVQCTSLTTDFLKGGMTVSSDKLVIPVAGKYQVNWALCWENTAVGVSAAGEYQSQVWQNGGQVRTAGQYTASGGNPIPQGSSLITCAVGDTLALYGWQTSGSTQGVCYNTAGQGAQANFLEATLVSI